MSARNLVIVLALGLLAGACERRTPWPGQRQLGGFLVTIDVAAGGVQGVDLVCPKTSCLEWEWTGFNGRALSGSGTFASPFDFPSSGAVAFYVQAQALDTEGQNYVEFNWPLAVRVMPGRLVRTFQATTPVAPTIEERMIPSVGGVGRGYVVARAVFGGIRVWVEDRDAEPDYAIPPSDDPNSTIAEPPPYASVPNRTFIGGSTDTIWFETPYLADVQRLSPADIANSAQPNRTSPLIGNYLTISRGDMVVTGVAPDGFYVTDRSAKKLTTAPYDGYPGTFGHVFVYNYNYPDDLYAGDLLSSLTGTVQEFSSDTQLSWPSWVRLERPTGLPDPSNVPGPVVLDRQICATNPTSPYSTDLLCGYSNKNMKVESLESALVALMNVSPSTAFASCDKNGNSSVPIFFATSSPNECIDCTAAGWCCQLLDPATDCQDSTKRAPEADECLCYRDCVTSSGEYSSDLCSELSTWRTYGQWLVKLDDTADIRISIQTRDALPTFDPRVFSARCSADDERADSSCAQGTLKYGGTRLNVVGNLRHVQAARPRWMVAVRDPSDICCVRKAGARCPPGLNICPEGRQ